MVEHALCLERQGVGDKKVVSRQERLSRHKVGDRKVVSRQKKLSRDNVGGQKVVVSRQRENVSDLVLRQHVVCPSRDNQNDQGQQKRQPTAAVDPAEGKLRKITTQGPLTTLWAGALFIKRGAGEVCVRRAESSP